MGNTHTLFCTYRSTLHNNVIRGSNIEHRKIARLITLNRLAATYVRFVNRANTFPQLSQRRMYAHLVWQRHGAKIIDGCLVYCGVVRMAHGIALGRPFGRNPPCLPFLSVDSSARASALEETAGAHTCGCLSVPDAGSRPTRHHTLLRTPRLR